MLRFLLNGLYSSQRNNELHLHLYYQSFHSNKYVLEYWSGNDVIFVKYSCRVVNNSDHLIILNK